MGLWSKVKKAAKKVVRAIKGAARKVVKVIVGVVMRITNLWDVILGFLNWPPKRMRLRVVILSKWDEIKGEYAPLANPEHVQKSIDVAAEILRKRANVRLLPYRGRFIKTLLGKAPDSALKPRCDEGGFADEFAEAGEFYARHTAGWMFGIPISPHFPITAFVVDDVVGKKGCALGPTSDYLVIDEDGLADGGVTPFSTLAHEIGHVCALWHQKRTSNLMKSDGDVRGDKLRKYQLNILRSSRHVTYW